MAATKNKTQPLQFAVLATDVVCFHIINNELGVLLGKVQNNPHYPNHWANIGGLIRSTETAETAAKRLMQDKAGIKRLYLEQLYTFSKINRDPRNRVVSVAYLGIVNDVVPTERVGTFITRWCPVSQVPKLAYDHNEMLQVALERLRARVGYTNIAQYFLPPEFTFAEFQRVYEVILKRGMDKRNFRKKIMASGMLKETGRTRQEGVMRPAALYAFTSKDIVVNEIL